MTQFATDGSTITLPAAANPSQSASLTAVNGSAATFLRSDSAPAIDLSAAPLTKATTRAHTGLAGYRTADATSANATLTADTDLTITFNETGHFALDIYLAFYEATVSTGGFKFDLNGGGATVATLNLGGTGFITTTTANAAVTSLAASTGFGTISGSSSAPSWWRMQGYANVSATGTIAVRWSQNTLLGADPTTLMKGSYILATKMA